MLLMMTAQGMTTTPRTRGRAKGRVWAGAAAVCVGVGAALAVGHAVRPGRAVLEPPVWAGDIGTSTTDRLAVPLRETSASYTSPVVIQAASATRVARTCGSEPCPPARFSTKSPQPPRRPAPAAASVMAQTPPAADRQEAGAFSVAALRDRLPSAGALMKPIAFVGETMSGLVKRF